MKVLETQVFRGPNYYALKPVIRLEVDIEELEEKPSSKIPGFVDKLLGLLPSIGDHRCSEGVSGGFITRLSEGTWMGHILEHVAIELQCLTGTVVSFGRCRQTEKKGIYNVIYSYREERVGLYAGKVAVRLLHHCIYGDDFDLAEERGELAAILDEVAYGPSTQGIINKAKERMIPVVRLNEQNLVQLGHGIYQKRIQATVTSETTLIAVDIAGDKSLTKALLHDVGIPVPMGDVVRKVKGAVAAAEEVGYPVVVKPLNANHGKGVAVNLSTPEDVEAAAERALDFSERIVVERFLPGRDHRILVVNGKVVACAERVPAHVTGDGEHTIEELVAIENRNPMRGQGHEKPLTKIVVNDETLRILKSRGQAVDAVPKQGEAVSLKLTGNLSTGGTAIDRTDEIHFENIDIAERAARVVGLDVAGIDMITTDVSKPLSETKGGICEVNAAPGFRMHLHPTAGKPRDVAGAMLDMLFPPGTPSRVPVVSITGTNGKTTTARMLAHILKMGGRHVGLTTTDGVYIDGRRIVTGDCTGPWSCQLVLKDPTVDFAVLETARGGILRSGLGFDYCDIGVITNVTADHLGLRGIDTVEELAFVKALVLEVVKDDGHSMLNAEDPNLLPVRDRARGKLAYFSLHPENPIFASHVAGGGPGVTQKEGVITITSGGMEVPLLNVNSIPATFQGRALPNVANALVASLCAYLSGTKVDDIRQGLKTFDSSFHLAPGRLNLMEVRDFHVLIDYAHNPAAYRALTDFIGKLNVARRIGVLAAPGDRRDEDLREVGTIAAPHFDEFILKEDEDLRGRKPGAISAIMADGLRAAGVASNRIRAASPEPAAVQIALDMARKDDLVVITAEKIKQTFETIVKFRDGGAGRI
ncbi:MAG: cyanophycin synthetase [Acidobacteriota bacterium]